MSAGTLLAELSSPSELPPSIFIQGCLSEAIQPVAAMWPASDHTQVYNTTGEAAATTRETDWVNNQLTK